ncbi:MAG: HIT family protein [Candidatus Pacebacteria bacterium]|nr:HIT family protein [Candidatus Paceibacterota bacterium]
MSDCIFCKIADKEIPSYIVWENERFLVFADAKPINPGHLLIIPKEHIDSIFDLPDERYAEIFMIAKTLFAPLRRATDAKRIGIAVEGFGVPHAHLHLVPLHGGNELNPERARAMDEEELRKIANKIKEEIEKK